MRVMTDSLTEPQRACLRLVATHHNSKEIAHLLGVSPSAVDKRIERAVQILGARSRFAAARALAMTEGTPFAEPESVAEDGTSDRLPCDPIDLPPAAFSLPEMGQDEPWWLVRRLIGLSSPGHRVGGRTRNDLTVLQRLGVIMAVTLFVAVSSVAVLNMAVTLSGIVKDHRPARR
ncbi:sigma factor-like helix-turn-helix DNA-binding protein [Sphingomonas bacterium]|uniref:sigma factor-like helix-turn-helix DNA-binding protein n=1 Tax=Sphingomonas bacterium TaxID=1895847 RepID=UPI001575F46F|nr:sigma factor-like helix-turn-helix DNA-binding protein [Sphingomonas bacterium]